MGVQDIISELFGSCQGTKLEERDQLERVEIRVMGMNCECKGCERMLKKSVKGMEGVKQVEVNVELGKVCVSGFVSADKVLETVRHRTGKKVELWSEPCHEPSTSCATFFDHTTPSIDHHDDADACTIM